MALTEAQCELTVSALAHSSSYCICTQYIIVCPMLCMDKFTCVCVSDSLCLCASVTLSVNSPTGQTPQRSFTVDSLKDADIRKDVTFGGLDDE